MSPRLASAITTSPAAVASATRRSSSAIPADPCRSKNATCGLTTPDRPGERLDARTAERAQPGRVVAQPPLPSATLPTGRCPRTSGPVARTAAATRSPKLSAMSSSFVRPWYVRLRAARRRDRWAPPCASAAGAAARAAAPDVPRPSGAPCRRTSAPAGAAPSTAPAGRGRWRCRPGRRRPPPGAARPRRGPTTPRPPRRSARRGRRPGTPTRPAPPPGGRAPPRARRRPRRARDGPTRCRGPGRAAC